MKTRVKLPVLLISAMLIISCSNAHPDNLTGQVTDTSYHPHISQTRVISQEMAPPPSADLLPYAPPVIQQSFKNCYAYASAYAARTILYNVTYNYTNHPDSTIFSTGFLQKLIFPNTDSCRTNGYDTQKACAKIAAKGLVFRSDYPDDCIARELPAALLQKALNYRVRTRDLYEPCIPSADKAQAIIASIAAHHPVVLGWVSTSSFNGGGFGRESWSPTWLNNLTNSCHTKANHAMCVVGYDNNKNGGSIHVMNSWDITWGDHDLIWIRYQDLAKFSPFAIELTSL